MKVELFPFQKQALANLRLNTAEALGSYRRTHTPQIVSYTAPTGAGKTIIMSALIESIMFGDDTYPDQLDAIVEAPTAYSKIRSQPIIHAINSPIVAYEYV